MGKATEKRTYPAHFSATCKNGAKARRGAHHFKTGKYKRQWDITAANKAKRKARLFSFNSDILLGQT